MELALTELALKKAARTGDWNRASWLFQKAPQAPRYKRVMKGVISTSDDAGNVYLIFMNRFYNAQGSFGIDFAAVDKEGVIHCMEETQYDAVEMVRCHFEIWDDSTGDYKIELGENHERGSHADDKLADKLYEKYEGVDCRGMTSL